MSKVKEDRDECTSVEKFIWDKVAVDWGNFAGVKSVSLDELLFLKTICEMEILKRSKE